MEIKCPHCDKDLIVEDSEINEITQCPSCQKAFTIDIEKPPVMETEASSPEHFKGKYKYKSEPFIGLNKNQLNPHEMAMQLESVINEQSSNGWEFVQHADVQVMVQPGCFGGFLGGKASVHHVNQLIFRKEI